MTSVRVKLNKLPKIRDQLVPQASRAIERGGFKIEQRTKENMARAKSGRRYKRGSSVHVASAPGEAPAIDTGTLVNSIRTAMLRPLVCAVQATARHARFLYQGTSRMAPRPFLEPEARELVPEIEREVREAVRRATS